MDHQNESSNFSHDTETIYIYVYNCDECGEIVNSHTSYHCYECKKKLCKSCYHYGFCPTHFQGLEEIDQERAKSLTNQLKHIQTFNVIGIVTFIIIFAISSFLEVMKDPWAPRGTIYPLWVVALGIPILIYLLLHSKKMEKNNIMKIKDIAASLGQIDSPAQNENQEENGIKKPREAHLLRLPGYDFSEKQLQKLAQILRVSKRVKMKMIQSALNLKDEIFNTFIFDWADNYGYTIDGDDIIIRK